MERKSTKFDEKDYTEYLSTLIDRGLDPVRACIDGPAMFRGSRRVAEDFNRIRETSRKTS